MKNADMPINAVYDPLTHTGEYVKSEGLTKREYFAGLAMKGFLSGPHAEADCGIEGLAQDAVLAADYLLKALERKK